MILLNNTHKRAWNGETIYKLSKKLTPYEWNAIKRYFVYFKQDDITGWGTTKPVDTIRNLLQATADEEFTRLQETINETQRKVANSNGPLEAEKWIVLTQDCKRQQDKLIFSKINL